MDACNTFGQAPMKNLTPIFAVLAVGTLVLGSISIAKGYVCRVDIKFERVGSLTIEACAKGLSVP